jgi:hypothetical protein
MVLVTLLAPLHPEYISRAWFEGTLPTLSRGKEPCILSLPSREDAPAFTI